MAGRFTGVHGKAAAIAEVAGVFICGTVAARLIAKALALETRGLRDLAPGATPDFLALAWTTGANLLLRYGLILGLAFAIGWWLRRRTLREYGVARPKISLRAAVVLFAAAGLVPKLIIFLKDYIPLGAEPAHWKLIDTPNTLAFWVYMAVSSFLLVPVVEELFFRGYVQTRLREEFGASVAIVVVAVFFMLAHRQYFIASGVGIGMALSLLFGALVFCYVREISGSLWPGVIAHALGNVPVRGWALAALNLLLIAIVIVDRHLLMDHLRALKAMLPARDVGVGVAVAVGVTVVVLGVALALPAALVVLGVVALLYGVLVGLQRRARVEPHRAA